MCRAHKYAQTNHCTERWVPFRPSSGMDFEKAFDSVDRECIWVTLGCSGIAGNTTSNQINTAAIAKCSVLHAATLSSSFEMQCAIRQGCNFSAIQFLVVIGDVINSDICKFWNSGITWTISSFLQHLDYAHNICLLTHSVLDIAEMLYSKKKLAQLDLFKDFIQYEFFAK